MSARSARTRAAVLGLVASAVLTGCSLRPGQATAPPIPVPTAAATRPSPATRTPTVNPTPAAPDPSVTIGTFPTPSVPTTAPSPKGLHVTQARIRGRSRSASWDISIPAISGARVADEANRRVRAAALDLVTQVKRESKEDSGDKRTLSGDGTVVTNDGRTVQVVIMFSDYLAGTAHPALYVTTTVVDVKRRQPVLLTQIIQNPPEGLRFLKTQVIKAAGKKGDGVDATGLAPKIANWANWQTTRSGMRFYFNDYQLGGHGIRAYTVPWKASRLVLSDYGERLLTPQ